MGVDRRLIKNFDWLMLGIVLALSVVGIMTIYSATRPLPGGTQPTYYIKQIYWLIVGLCVMATVVFLDYNWFFRNAYYLYIGGVILLVLVLIIGRTGMGAQRWLSIGPLGFQPSEIFKIIFIMAIARYINLNSSELDIKSLLKAFMGFVLIPLILILKQPDLGTSLVLLFLFVGLVMTKGVGRKVITLVLLISVISVPFLGKIVWDELKPYQKKRITAFISMADKEKTVSYHVRQSKIAVGSGGVLGKGYLKGTQGPFRFLPEKHTDFIFAIFAEEWGFFGCIVLLGAYIALLMRGIHTAYKAKDAFGRYLALGIVYSYTIYIFVNIGMTVGLAPVVGIPLPFMSYGGTAIVTNFFAAGLLISIRARRFELFF